MTLFNPYTKAEFMYIYQPPYAFEIAGIFMQNEFDQFADQALDLFEKGDVNHIANIVFYYDHLTPDRQERMLKALTTKIIKVSLYSLHSNILAYEHVKEWFETNADYFNSTFEKSLKRKRSMEGDVTLLSRWLKLLPNGDWKKHLDGDLATWTSVPNKAVDTEDIDALLSALKNDHPKRGLLVAYRMVRSTIQERRNRDFVHNEMVHIVSNTHVNTSVIRYNTIGVLDLTKADDVQFIMAHWNHALPSVKEMFLAELLTTDLADIQDVMMPMLTTYDPDIQSFITRTIENRSYFGYFEVSAIQRVFEQQSISVDNNTPFSLLLFAVAPHISDSTYAHFLAEYFIARHQLPTYNTRGYRRYQMGTLTALSQHALDRFFAEASDGYLMTMLMLTLMNQYADYWYRENYVELTRVQVNSLMASVASRFTEKYPILTKMLQKRAQNGSTTPVILDLMNTFVEHQVGADNKDVYNMVENMYNIEHPFVFNQDFEQFHRMNYCIHNGTLAIHRLERNHHRATPELAIHAIQEKADMLQLLIAKNTATWDEVDVMF